MKEKMLSAVSDPTLKQELERLFGEFPFSKMTVEYSRRTNYTGETFDDSSILLLDQHAPEMLATYLHEIAHASLIRAGWEGKVHGEDFVKVCRELQLRFGVSQYADHTYDQQDSLVKKSHFNSVVSARHYASQTTYNPLARAGQLVYTANETEQRGIWQGLFVVAAIAVIGIVGIAAPWAALFAAAGTGAGQLVAGFVVVLFLWGWLR